MPRWARVRQLPRRYVADWRARFARPPWNVGTTHALASQWAELTDCGAIVPEGAERVGFGAVTCPKCKEAQW